MNLKKILPIVVIALVAFFLIDQPDQMAQLLRNILNTLGDGAQAIITFAKQLTR
jgi:preprotein translocase subunit YajC